MLVETAILGRLLSGVTGHDIGLAAVFVTGCLVIGAVLVITLIAAVPADDRVDAIYAVAEVLRALLPWPRPRRRSKSAPCRARKRYSGCRRPQR